MISGMDIERENGPQFVPGTCGFSTNQGRAYPGNVEARLEETAPVVGAFAISVLTVFAIVRLTDIWRSRFSTPGYEPEIRMNHRTRRLLFYGVACPLACLIVVLGRSPVIAWLTACAIIGAFAVWEIARWTNLRHDPRHAKRPPDAP